MLHDWYEFLPEIKWVKDEELQKKIVACYEDAAKDGGWEDLDVLASVPFSVNIPGLTITLREHFRNVTYMCDLMYHAFAKCYDDYEMNYDYLIAGALLHDVGKVAEYGLDAEGRPYITESGKLLKHVFSGAGYAMRHDLPQEVVHIIAVHADEGVGKYRSPEAVILNKMDLVNFDTFKAYAGMVQKH